MHLNAKPPIFVPEGYRREIEQMSKAALMDLVWGFATASTYSVDDHQEIMETLRRRRDIILEHRKLG
jgi:hypothetical protein